jgi:hypothetical protein
MRDPGLAAVLSAIIPGIGQFYNGRILAGTLDRNRWPARLGSARRLGLHCLLLCPRSPGTRGLGIQALDRGRYS